MLHLKLLGSLSVDCQTGPLTGRGVQRHRLALLSVLATQHARGLGVGRERLVSLLWPEADPDRGRPLLSDSVYRINRSVGGDAIVSLGDELRLNERNVSSDVAVFERANAAEERERAVSVYRGPLLDGVHLVDGLDFERWLDTERDRLARMYESALRALAQGAETAGEMADAVGWWRRLAAHDPCNSHVAMRLMHSLATLGDPAGAIRHARIHMTLVQQELGVSPNAAVLRLAERLAASLPEAAGATLASAPRPRTPTHEGGRVAVESRESEPRKPNAAPIAAASIAVLPFVDLSPDRDNTPFSDGMTDELITTFTHVSGVRVAARTSVFALRNNQDDVREVGRRLGVATVLAGSIRKSGARIRITVQLANAIDGFQVWSESYDRELDDVFAVQVDVSRSIVRAVRKRLVPRAPVHFAGVPRP